MLRPPPAHTHDTHAEDLICSHEPSPDMSHPRSAKASGPTSRSGHRATVPIVRTCNGAGAMQTHVPMSTSLCPWGCGCNSSWSIHQNRVAAVK